MTQAYSSSAQRSDPGGQRTSRWRSHRRLTAGGGLLLAALAVGVLVGRSRLATAERGSIPSLGDPALHVVATLSERRLDIMDGEQVVESFPIAIGQPDYPTPPGEYAIRRIVWNPEWVPPPGQKWAKGKHYEPPGAAGNPMKVVKIFFKEPAYYIHGTNDPQSLGHAESHGCLRMDPDDAYEVGRYLMDHGGQPRDESWFWRVLHFRDETTTVYLDHPVPMEVAR
jgi:lipoprotein-anchoring transpeptidase ErfK/SrfK